ncbi:MAG TPA: hypothetical protein VLK84_00590 [Longimicrobium sp.]|nr:hypothetical protein [Longimicrobium sp.]
MYDDSHTFKVVSQGTKDVSAKSKQKGMREYLLCRACEQHLSKFETYAAGLLRRIDEAVVNGAKGGVQMRFDPKAFRLFGLSLLWRMGIARTPMFDQVRLGPHAEPIRSMIAAGDPGSASEYGFLIGRSELTNVQGFPIIAPVALRGVDRRRMYRLGALGYNWDFYVDSRLKSLGENIPFLGCDAIIRVPLFPPTRLEFRARKR